MKHKYDEIEEKQIIISAIKRIHDLLGKTPTQKEYQQLKERDELSIHQIYYRYSNWTNAILAAGLAPNPFQSPPRQPEITKEKLINIFIEVANKLRKIPSNHEFIVHANCSWTPYKTKWGSFKQAIGFITQNYKDRFLFDFELLTFNNKEKKDKLLTYDCNMLYEPRNEYETIALFAMVSKSLGFKIKHIRADFPDAILINASNEEVLAEFEYLSSNYRQHCHPSDFKGICICWRKDIELGNIRIISIEEWIKNYDY